MLRRRLWISTLTLLAFTGWLLTLAGCGSDDVAGTGPEQLEIPPVSTFVMDFGDFMESTTLAQTHAGTPEVGLGSAKQNWSYAALNVLVWNTVLTVGLAVPAASFIAAFGHEPVFRTDGTWIWLYNFYANDLIHLAELHGRVDGDEVLWTMYISREGDFTDFIWYTGVSDLDGTEGTWTLNKDPGDPTPMLDITWHRDPQAGTADITYTNIIPDDPENGGYISYGITNETPLDAFYDIYKKSADNHTHIEWSRTTKEGRVKDPNHFGDSDWHCWDGELEDDDCP